MKVSNSARDALLNIMRSKSLDPRYWYFELKLLSSGAIGVGFIKDIAQHEVQEFGELKLAIDLELDTDEFGVDFAEHNGRRGLIFSHDKQLNL